MSISSCVGTFLAVFSDFFEMALFDMNPGGSGRLDALFDLEGGGLLSSTTHFGGGGIDLLDIMQNSLSRVAALVSLYFCKMIATDGNGGSGCTVTNTSA